MLLRFCLGWIVVWTMAVTTAGAEETTIRHRFKFYEQAPWTVAFVPNITRSTDFGTTRKFVVYSKSARYNIETQNTYCFAINHRLPKLAGEPSYLGVAAFSILKEIHHDHPVSMFRNTGWKRGNDTSFSANNDRLKTSPLLPRQFFETHSDSAATFRKTLNARAMLKARKTLDDGLGHRWHGEYGEAYEHSWDHLDLWDLSNDISLELITELGGSGWQRTRFDGKLISFEFTKKRASKKPPIFCLEGDNRVAAVIWVFSPDRSTSWKFEFVFS